MKAGIGLSCDSLYAGSSINMGHRRYSRPPFFTNPYHQQHIRTFTFQLKKAIRIFSQNRRGEGSKILTELDLKIDEISQLGPAGVAQNTSVTQRSGAELSPPLEPCNRFPSHQ
ncbi:MAG: hypothetical protein A3G29_03440 [Burkholderiales bacterium RIFCSPLOWO2_12_FULL_64_99]|nr:MAG: hypothetical protein A3E52_11400 [Burkholderiales bacterium RIFCSPHIGHO2_12_FULL_63_20]OGB64535.1 MAG: hypothetical protein A3G29_03440 [Burkholderiales bacterium RIFCSPLOWO2_12_FULL_64_99]